MVMSPAMTSVKWGCLEAMCSARTAFPPAGKDAGLTCIC